MKVTAKYWSKGSITRYYFVDENDKNLGYYQELSSPRSGGYYNNHRTIKGDSTKIVPSDTITDAFLKMALMTTNVNGGDEYNANLIRSMSDQWTTCDDDGVFLKGNKLARQTPLPLVI